MPKKPKTARASASARVVPPKGTMRLTVRVRRTGRTMRMSIGEARALHALKVIEYIDPAPPAPIAAPVSAPVYSRRDMVAPPAMPTYFSFPVVKKDDGEA